MINRKDYPHPVKQLITHGALEGGPFEPEQWFDYVGHYGLSEIDVPPLLTLMTEARRVNKKRAKEFYAPIHAVRALGQLGDMAADSGLTQRLDQHEDDDLVENVVAALTMVGPRALDRLKEYYYHPFTHPDSRSRALEAIWFYATRHPEQRDPCVQLLMQALESYRRQATWLNGFIVYYLTRLKATEAAALISQAFDAGQVQDDISGSWAAVQVALGLATEADFSPDELLSAEDRQRQQAQGESTAKSTPAKRPLKLEGLSSSYSIIQHLRR